MGIIGNCPIHGQINDWIFIEEKSMNKSLAIRQKAELAKINKEFQQGVEWLVLDVSASMGNFIPNTGNAKTQLSVAEEVIRGYGEHIHVCTFHNSIELFKGPKHLETGGSTEMHKGLDAILPYQPSYALIISDGAVDNQELARASAQRLSENAIIETLYIGPDDERAEAFMKELANIGCGRYRRYDMTKPQTMQLEQVVRALLPAPQHVIES
jgi:hypothetical protein